MRRFSSEHVDSFDMCFFWTSLVVVRVIWVRKVENNRRVRAAATAFLKRSDEVDGAIERQATVVIDINVESLVISWDVDDTDVSALNKVVGDKEMLLIRSKLDVVWTDCWLLFIWVVKALDVLEVTDVQSGNVVGLTECDVEIFAILADVGAVKLISNGPLVDEVGKTY